MDKLDTTNSTETDKLFLWTVQKLNKQQMLESFARTFNCSLQLKKDPEDWKLQNVKLIFKILIEE